MKNKGFTLIELLTVVAIIGILASIVVVNVSSSREKARDARRKTELDSLRNALELYANANNGKYPIKTAGLNALKDAGYLDKVPADPKDGTPYVYENTKCDGTGTQNNLLQYSIRAILEQGSATGGKKCSGDDVNYYFVVEN